MEPRTPHAPTTLHVSHYKPVGIGDRIALGAVKFLRLFADAFFRGRYGHRAVVLETVAAVPGMVGGMLTHLRALRRFQDDRGWIRTLLDEAENERAHLMTFIQVAQPNWFERALIILAQGIFFNGFFLFYILWPRVAHRFVGYLEEEAVYSYTEYLADIDAGDKVLHIGCGSGYGSAILARLGKEVVAVEADEVLAAIAVKSSGAKVHHGDPAKGRAVDGPFDAILVEGRIPEVPASLLRQLRDGGRLVAVVGENSVSNAVLYTANAGTVSSRPAFDASVAPLPGFPARKELGFVF